MVLIEEAVSSEVKVEPRTKLEESSTSSTAAGGDTSDGFETASEDGHPDNDDKDEEVGTEVKDIEHQSTTEDHPSYHDSLTDEQLHQVLLPNLITFIYLLGFSSDIYLLNVENLIR